MGRQILDLIESRIMLAQQGVEESQFHDSRWTDKSIPGDGKELHGLFSLADGRFFSAQAGVCDTQCAMEPSVFRGLLKLVFEEAAGLLISGPCLLGLTQKGVSLSR